MAALDRRRESQPSGENATPIATDITFRFRRLDALNFVIERTRGAIRWQIIGYYASLDAMLRAALRQGICGDSPAELLASVASAEARVLAALQVVVETGALLECPSRGSTSVRGTNPLTDGNLKAVAGGERRR